MFIQIDPSGAVSLMDADDMHRFSIRMARTDAARAALVQIARPDGADHAWIAPAEVRALVPGATLDWLAQFTAMTEYAAGKGWTDMAGALRAHIDYGRDPGRPAQGNGRANGLNIALIKKTVSMERRIGK